MRVPLLSSSLLLALLIASSASAVTVHWTYVGDLGNACDPQSQGCFGSVAYGYLISKYEITNAQSTEFLNAIAATDTNGLYNTSMASGFGGITRSGSSGSYTYSVIAGRGALPVNYVSFYSALRFVNWLNNGQPVGDQDFSTTEDGAYTFTGPTTVGGRNAGAAIFLTSEDEWYKAAYYNPTTATYFAYPAGSDTATTCAAPTATANRANCNATVSDLTNVGSYTGSPSPYGSFDQGGNVREWNEAIINVTRRGQRGGTANLAALFLAAATQDSNPPASAGNTFGFRVAPEPAFSLGLAASLVMLLGLAGWVRWVKLGRRGRHDVAGNFFVEPSELNSPRNA